MKKCKKCNLLKQFDLFYKNSLTNDGFSYACKECDKIKSRENKKNIRENNPVLYKYRKIKERSTENGWPFLITFNEFYDWYQKQFFACSYCDLVDLSLDLKKIKRKDISNFTIDRKNSDLPYTIENICFSCWTCNTLKSDFFTYDEFKEIGQKYIKNRWFSGKNKSDDKLVNK